MNELKVYVSQIIAEEFQTGFESGLIPKESKDTELQALYEFNVNLLYELICSEPYLKARILEAKKQNIKLSLEELFTFCSV